MRRWSVLRWPVALAAMSDMTPSAGPPSHARKPLRRLGIVEIHAPELDALDRIDLQEIDGDHPSPALARLRSGRAATWLQPPGAAPRSTMRWPGSKSSVFLVDLQQLVGRARPVALAAGLRDIGVVELALEPQGRGEGALARGLHPRLQRPAALAARAARSTLGVPAGARRRRPPASDG